VTGRGEGRGYDAVRDALRERGYLETPLERLFLGTGRAPWQRIVLSALLAGLIAGPLLAAILAAVVVAGSRGLVPAWPDGVLYGVLFAPVLGLVVALGEALAALLVRLAGRLRPDLSPRRASLAAGLGAAGVLAAWLGTWWALRASDVTPGDLAGLLALVLGAGITGRIVAAATLPEAIAAAGRGPRRRSRAFLPSLGLALVLAVTAALVATLAPVRRGGARIVPAADAPDRVVLLGWDGMGLPEMRGLLDRDFPGAADLLGGGVVLPVDAAGETDPVALWTSLATGCSPATHGVLGAGMRGLQGAHAPLVRRGLAAGPLEVLSRLWPTVERPVRAGVRRVPALWEYTADAVKTGVVGWWGTWPSVSPGPAGGYVVSDGAFVAAVRGKGLAEANWPASFGRGRAPGWLREATRAAREVFPGADPGPARDALRVDLFHLAAARDILRDPEVRALFVYLPGADLVRDGCRRAGRDPWSTLERLEALARAELPRLEELRTPGTLLVVVGMPGRAGCGERGFLVLPPGPGAVPREILRPEDVAPTVLALSGYPVDTRIEGRSALPGVRRVRTRVEPARAPAASPELEADVLERLRSLGYVR